jgi:hypothetical protein
MATMSAKRQQQPKAAPRTAKADEDRKIARRSLAWTRRNAILAGLGIIVAIAIAVVSILATNRQGPASPASQQPPGVAVNTVPIDPVGGAPILPVAAATVTPSAYLGAGVQLYIDCLQPVGGKYLLARISYGQYENEWIDIFDIRTPENQDVQHLKPPLPECNKS